MTDFFDDGIESEGCATSVDPDSCPDAVLAGPSRVVTARGTEDGLILRIDGKAEWQEILEDLESFLGGRRKFFEGGEVSIEWLERLPTKEQSKELEDLLRDHYGIEIVVRRRKPQTMKSVKDDKGNKPEPKKNSGVTIPLFDEVDNSPSILDLTADPGMRGFADDLDAFCERDSRMSMGRGEEMMGSSHKRHLNRMNAILSEDVYCEDDANAKVMYGTLRSGQRIETPFSLIVIGDVNPGADLVAGGDIIVLGNLRGTAHASAYDDDSFDRVIIALKMQPMQLRIGSVISRGSSDEVSGAEIARIENRRIIVEPFSTRSVAGKKLR